MLHGPFSNPRPSSLSDFSKNAVVIPTEHKRHYPDLLIHLLPALRLRKNCVSNSTLAQFPSGSAPSPFEQKNGFDPSELITCPTITYPRAQLHDMIYGCSIAWRRGGNIPKSILHPYGYQGLKKAYDDDLLDKTNIAARPKADV